MRNRKEYEKAHALVKSALYKIDPCDLMSSGSPEDELNAEAGSIVRQLQRCHSAKDLACAISRTLTSSFGEKFLPEELESESQNLFERLQAEYLI